MTREHYIIFVGASASLSSELLRLQRRLQGVQIIAPAMGKKYIGVNRVSSIKAINMLYNKLIDSKYSDEPARLSLWFYEPSTPDRMEQIWSTFGHSAWVERIPRSYLDKNGPTREFIDKRIKKIVPLLHEISCATYGQRKTSPLTLPLRNFSSKITRELKQYWYNDLEKDQVAKKLKSFKQRLSKVRNREKSGYVDDKSLIFCPAKDSELHGKVHPTGSSPKSFACGRFRYGVALFPGFHFDVSAFKTPTIQCELRTSNGGIRAVKSEKLTYINIFPNDYLLPDK